MDCRDFDDDFDSESDFDEIIEEEDESGNITTRKQRVSQKKKESENVDASSFLVS